MKKIALFTAMLLSFASGSTLANVTLNIGDNVVVTAINGQEVKNGLFSEPQRKFDLQAGKHVITAKYSRLYELRGDNHDVLRSSNISLPVELADNQSYDLVMANQPEDYNQAKEYVKKPTLAIVQNGKIVANQQAVNGGSTGLFGGLGGAIGGIFGKSNAIEANQQAISAISSNQSPNNQTVSRSTDTLDQFMDLWLKATPAERDKIRQWVAK